MSNKTYLHVSLKASLRRKLKLCWLLLNDRPIMYRVGVTHGNIYIPESVHVECTHIVGNTIRQVDDEGRVVVNPLRRLPDYTSPLPVSLHTSRGALEDFVEVGGTLVPHDKWS